MKIGSLCTGYGGLDLAIEAAFNAETVWTCEIDRFASQIIEQRFDKPNLGDLKTVNWQKVEPIDILTAGYPCQPFSHAGYRKGTEDERHIWPHIKEIIGTLRPGLVILENVRGHLSLGFKDVLKDLAEIGYDARWDIVRASDVGAPHQRARLFVIAYPNGEFGRIPLSHEAIAYAVEYGFKRGFTSGHETTQSPASIATFNAGDQFQPHDGKMQKLGRRFASRREMQLQDVPPTLDDGKLSALFVEYMMGLPGGWVTGCSLSRAQQLKILGNGVVPQQAFHAITKLMTLDIENE